MEIEKKIEQANEKVMDIMLNGRPTWVDVKPAGEVVPGMEKNMILVAGPPIAVEKYCKARKNRNMRRGDT